MNYKILGLAAVAVLCLHSCKNNTEEKSEPTHYTATSPWVKDTVITRQYVSQVRAIQHIELRALEKGYLNKIYVDEGQMVRQGQLMFEILPVIYSAEFQKAKAEAEYAEIEYNNTKQLAQKNVVSPNELALSKAKWDKAKAEMALSQSHLQFTKIKAPFTGIMDHFQVRLGSLVNEGDLLTTLSDNSQLWVYFNVPEAEYLNYKTRATTENLSQVKFLMANNQEYPFTGKVETIEADFNNETGNIAFRATFPNPKGLLRHGETGNILMPIALKKAMIIPQKATFEILEKRYVYVIDAKGRVHAREIQIAEEMPDIYVVKSGISPSDKIVLEGIRKVQDGDVIQYRFESPKQVVKKLQVYVE